MAMYTPGRIYRPVFQPPCGGNGFRNAADTARPVLITIHTYCPHILPIPAPCRLLPTILQHMESINFYGYPSTAALPPPATTSSSTLLRRLTTGHLIPLSLREPPRCLFLVFFSSLPTFTNYRTRLRKGLNDRALEDLRPDGRCFDPVYVHRQERKWRSRVLYGNSMNRVPRVDILRPVTYNVCKCVLGYC